MTPSKLAFLILEARTLEHLQQTVRDALIKERLMTFNETLQEQTRLQDHLSKLQPGAN